MNLEEGRHVRVLINLRLHYEYRIKVQDYLHCIIVLSVSSFLLDFLVGVKDVIRSFLSDDVGSNKK